MTNCHQLKHLLPTSISWHEEKERPSYSSRNCKENLWKCAEAENRMNENNSSCRDNWPNLIMTTPFSRKTCVTSTSRCSPSLFQTKTTQRRLSNRYSTISLIPSKITLPYKAISKILIGRFLSSSRKWLPSSRNNILWGLRPSKASLCVQKWRD
jgi:hypothetical protein